MSWVVDLSRHHKPRAGQANLYGVIIYTNKHAFVTKMLKDETYWNALDELSGPRWAVFATCAAQGHYGYPESRPGMLQMMVPVWKEPGENQQLLQVFDLDSTKHLPALVVFAEGPGGTLLKNAIRIDDSSEEAAYKSLMTVFSEVADALDFMYDENRRKEAVAFEVVEERLRSLKGWRFLKKTFAILERIKSLLS